jgi:pimeloyl-ACP methyl ester carboxylesterase
MKTIISLLTFVSALFIASSAFAQSDKPIIVLVHGAFADASSWNGTITALEKDGYTVIAAANPLRGVKSDAAYVYGGNVISTAANGHSNVKALVYVSAFAPEAGETAAGLSGQFPGSTLGPTLAAPVTLSEGGKDLYIQQDKFRDQFAADVPLPLAKLLAATQRPVTEAALNEKAGDPAWKYIPASFIYGDADKNIPPQALAFMAKRAQASNIEVIKGGSHVVMVSHPKQVARMIERAADATR